jgi:hypothetical protein
VGGASTAGWTFFAFLFSNFFFQNTTCTSSSLSDRHRLKTAPIDLKICGEVPHIMWTMAPRKKMQKTILSHARFELATFRV